MAVFCISNSIVLVSNTHALYCLNTVQCTWVRGRLIIGVVAFILPRLAAPIRLAQIIYKALQYLQPKNKKNLSISRYLIAHFSNKSHRKVRIQKQQKYEQNKAWMQQSEDDGYEHTRRKNRLNSIVHDIFGL